MNGYSTAATLHNQPDLLARLQNVVQLLHRSDIRTVSALIAKALGDQNAAMMAVRLLYWFPRSKKAGAWVYKSWRDWNAECNLSQAQVKRVHSKGFLETIGIERTIMKANGTPTVHYRLDENQMVRRLAEFLEVLPHQIQLWMCPVGPNEDSQSRSTHKAELDQLNESNQPNNLGEAEPMNSATTAKSITDSASQTRQHKNPQAIQHDSYSAVVAHAASEDNDMLLSLKKLGINDLKAKQLIDKHGDQRVTEIIKFIADHECRNPAGYAIRALENNWTFLSAPVQDNYVSGNGEAYVKGKYAAFIQH